jgi:hypothetical protein
MVALASSGPPVGCGSAGGLMAKSGETDGEIMTAEIPNLGTSKSLNNLSRYYTNISSFFF